MTVRHPKKLNLDYLTRPERLPPVFSRLGPQYGPVQRSVREPEAPHQSSTFVIIFRNDRLAREMPPRPAWSPIAESSLALRAHMRALRALGR